MAHPRIAILCRHLVLLNTDAEQFLYAIPDMKRTMGSAALTQVSALPLPVDGSWKAATGNPEDKCHCQHHSGSLVHIPKIDIQDRPHDDIDMLFELAFLSLETASKNYYPFTIPHAVGFNRAVWSDSCQNRIHLESSICSAKHHMYAGYMRLWRSDLSDPHRIASVAVMDYEGFVYGISFDEGSGKICLMVRSRTGFDRMLVMIDLIDSH